MAVRETEEFAEYLRGLKERSGHSYGTLARRLHTSTSTLHRYCNGTAVPARYAPAERLARLCGASPEELLELHRRWLRADMMRGRTGPERPVPPPEATSEVEPEAGAESTPEPDAPETESEPGPGTGAESGEPTPAPPGWRRALLWPVAAVLAVALVVTAVVWAAPGRPDRERPSAGGAAEPGPTDTAPLAWTARSHVWRHGCDHRYLIDLPPSRVPPPPVEQDAAGWAGSLGAVHGGETIMEATVRGTGDVPVVVEAVHVRVVARRAPLVRPSFEMNNGCGGSLAPAAFSVDLDAPRPSVEPVDGYDGDGGKHLPAVRLPYRVAVDEPLALRIEARTEGCDCDWYVELEWSSGDDSGTLRVDDGGRPFRTSAAEGRPTYGWSVADGVWTGG